MKNFLVTLILLLPILGLSQERAALLELDPYSRPSDVRLANEQIVISEQTELGPRLTLVDQDLNLQQSLYLATSPVDPFNDDTPIGHQFEDDNNVIAALNTGHVVKYNTQDETATDYLFLSSDAGERHSLDLAVFTDHSFVAFGDSEQGGTSSPRIHHYTLYSVDLISEEIIKKEVDYQAMALFVKDNTIDTWHQVDSNLISNQYDLNLELISTTSYPVEASVRQISLNEQGEYLILQNYYDSRSIVSIINMDGDFSNLFDVTDGYDKVIASSNNTYILSESHSSFVNPLQSRSSFSIIKVDHTGEEIWTYENDFAYSGAQRDFFMLNENEIIVTGVNNISDVLDEQNTFILKLDQTVDARYFSFQNNLTVYPNPGYDHATITWDKSPSAVHLIDQLGRIVSVNHDENRIDLSSIQPGLYHILIDQYMLISRPLLVMK